MMRLPFVSLLLLFIPLAEIAAFILVGQRIGALATIGLVVLAALAGFILIRVQGMSAFRRFNLAMRRGERPGRTLVDGFMIMLAGVLLILPGFLSDAMGLLLFIPFIRHFIWKRAGRRLAGGIRFAHFEMRSESFSTSPDEVVDLDPDEFRKTAEASRAITRGGLKDPGRGL